MDYSHGRSLTSCLWLFCASSRAQELGQTTEPEIFTLWLFTESLLAPSLGKDGHTIGKKSICV